jgi:hypothetical protein
MKNTCKAIIIPLCGCIENPVRLKARCDEGVIIVEKNA